jgi:hypothetical protein
MSPVVLKFLASKVAQRFAMEFPSQEALQKYLQQHPKADKSNHSVKKTEAPSDKVVQKPTQDAKAQPDVQAPTSGKEVEPEGGRYSRFLTKMIHTFQGKTPTKEQISEIMESVNSVVADYGHERYKGLSQINELAQSLGVKLVSDDRDLKPQKGSSEVVTPTSNGFGRNSGEINLGGELRARYDEIAHQVGGARENHEESIVSVYAAKSGLSESDVKKLSDWTEKWVSGVQQDGGEGGVGVTINDQEMVDEFCEGLKDPNSWQRHKYEATQAYIRKNMSALVGRGVMDKDGYLTLYRGFRGSAAQKYKKGNYIREVAISDRASLRTRGLAAWSENRDGAKSFARDSGGSYSGFVAQQKIHYTRVVNMWQGENDRWHTEEAEYSILPPESGVFEDCVVFEPRAVYQKIEPYGYEEPDYSSDY